jgi:hypothetical protein
MTPTTAGKVGDGFLSSRFEQALAGQSGLQPLQLGQQGAGAGGLHGLDDDLVGGAGGIGGDLAGDDDLQPGLGLDAETPGRALPDHAVDGGLVVLEGQIDVARGVAVDLGDLAAQPDMAEPVLERALEGEGQFRDRLGRIVVAGRAGGSSAGPSKT